MELVGLSPIQQDQTTEEFHRSSENIPHSECRFLPTRNWGHCYCVLRDKDNTVVYIVIRSAEDSIENCINNSNNNNNINSGFACTSINTFLIVIFPVAIWRLQYLLASCQNYGCRHFSLFTFNMAKLVYLGKRELDRMTPLRGSGISSVAGLLRCW